MDAPSPWNFFKIYNLKTTNAIEMKLTMVVYLHEAFHFTKDLGVTHKVWEGVVEKPLKKPPENRFFGFISRIFSTTFQPQNEAFGLISLYFQDYNQKP